MARSTKTSIRAYVQVDGRDLVEFFKSSRSAKTWLKHTVNAHLRAGINPTCWGWADKHQAPGKHQGRGGYIS